MELGERKRKELAAVVGELLNIVPEYQRSNNYAYEIGEVTLSRENTLIFPSNFNTEVVRELLAGLADKGFTAESLPDRLVIQMPLDGFDMVAMENLQKLVAAKAELIKKALGVDELSIEQTEEAVCFPWFAFDTSSEDVTAYTQFISALCDMAKKQKRVLATEKSVENEKYAFRCFLLRLGFIGEDYAESRRVLLRNLDGNGSWKNGNGSTSQSAPPTPSTNTLEESAEAIAKHLIKGIVHYLEAVI